MADLEAALKARHPANFVKHSVMMAVAGVAVQDGKMLFVRDQHGFWAGIGGWIETGETPEDALLREIREEIGVEAQITRTLRPALKWHVHEETSFLLFVFEVKLLSQDLRPDPVEVTDILWAGRDEWQELEMLPYVRAMIDERADEWLSGAGSGA